MRLTSGISIGLKKMVPLIGCSTCHNSGKTRQLRIKKRKIEKKNKKNEFHESLFVDLTSTILIVKYT